MSIYSPFEKLQVGQFNMQILQSFVLLADKVIKCNFACSVFKQVAVLA